METTDMYYVTVNKNVILGNRKHNRKDPPIRVSTGKKGWKVLRYVHDLQLSGPSRLVYRPDSPLACGARLWIETEQMEERK